MINWLIAVAGLALVTVSLHAWLSDRRHRRERSELRHITGSRPWWGKR